MGRLTAIASDFRLAVLIEMELLNQDRLSASHTVYSKWDILRKVRPTRRPLERLDERHMLRNL